MGKQLIYFDTFGASGGVGRVTRELLPALHSLTPVMAAGCSHVVDSLHGHIPAHITLLNLTPKKVSIRRFAYELSKRRHAPLWNLSTLLLSFLSKNYSQSPILVNFPQILPPPREGLRYSILIHDLNWLSLPGNFENPQQIDKRCRQWCSGADFIFCNSEFTRSELLMRYSTSEEQTVATPLAPFPTIGTNSNDPTVLERFNLQANRFFLFPGVIGLHKGHDLLASALKQANEPLPVVVTCGRPELAPLASKAAAHYLGELSKDFADLEAAGKLVVLRGLSDAEMSTLRQACRAFVLPSRYEGYGFPLAEAIMLGKPFIHSEIPAFHEITARHCSPAKDRRTFSNAIELTALLQDYSHSIPPSATMSPNQWNWLDCAQLIKARLYQTK